MSTVRPISCPDCAPEGAGLTRRDLLKGAAGLAAGAALGAAPTRPLFAANGDKRTDDELIAQFYNALTEDQKKAICFGWDHPRRLMISNNWRIVPQKIGEFLTPEQQEMTRKIFDSAHSGPEWIEKRLKQLHDDTGGLGFKDYGVAIFGEPGKGKYEWVMTGRHLTLRLDGDSEPGVAFGGPIFYGHAAQGFNEKPDHPGNVYWYQALRANEVFKALDGKQRDQALIKDKVPDENPTVLLSTPKAEQPGLPVATMSRDQRELVQKVMLDLLSPIRKSSVEEANRYLKANGGLDSLSMSFYSAEDVGSDGLWDVWMLKGPSMTWYFRGAPHVHTWVWIGEKPLTARYPSPT